MKILSPSNAQEKNMEQYHCHLFYLSIKAIKDIWLEMEFLIPESTPDDASAFKKLNDNQYSFMSDCWELFSDGEKHALDLRYQTWYRLNWETDSENIKAFLNSLKGK